MTRLVSEAEKDMMRDDYSSTLLDQLCTVQRNTETGKDPHGQRLPVVWANHLVAEPCRYWPVKEQERRGPNIDAVILDAEIEFAYGTDVQESDRILEVHELDGTPRGGPFEVKSIRQTDVNVRAVLIQGK